MHACVTLDGVQVTMAVGTSQGGTLYMLDMRSPAPVQQVPQAHAKEVGSLAINASPQGALLASGE